ncbi:MAG: GIY-YIG nuclease family protein [Cyclobacteriaceae bacterium]|nr:GIY-YIG nuclease family protein [Cyclobacteriaceae bacterium]
MYAIVDIETTGGYADHHRVTEIAIYHHDGVQITGEFHTLINPGRKIPHYITGLTGITTQMVEEAPAFDQVAQQVLDRLKDRVFVAHNAHFDYSFLKKEFEEAGLPFAAKKLCTVRLSRKIIPGLESYSLGRLAESLGIRIINRHRAGGDAQATARIFHELLRRDKTGVIAQALKRNSGETILPPNLPKGDFDRLPAKAGVYYFHNQRGEVIYVGKAINIKKRIAGHFTGEAREWNRSNIRNEICRITWELTGSELIALILEAQEIRRLWPKYNLAQKYKTEEWGVFQYEDRNGYQRFVVNQVVRGSQPMVTFTNKAEAWSFLWEKVKEYELCPKLSGLQLAKGLCFSHQSGTCKGACQGVESVKKYNKRLESAVSSFLEEGPTVAMIGKGRQSNEKSVVLVEKGSYVGFGFVDEEVVFRDVETVRQWVEPSRENRIVQNVVNSYLTKPRGVELVLFDALPGNSR